MSAIGRNRPLARFDDGLNLAFLKTTTSYAYWALSGRPRSNL
jgi:hypothetical protein